MQTAYPILLRPHFDKSRWEEVLGALETALQKCWLGVRKCIAILPNCICRTEAPAVSCRNCSTNPHSGIYGKLVPDTFLLSLSESFLGFSISRILSAILYTLQAEVRR